jgi:hypothetical protein
MGLEILRFGLGSGLGSACSCQQQTQAGAHEAAGPARYACPVEWRRVCVSHAPLTSYAHATRGAIAQHDGVKNLNTV